MRASTPSARRGRRGEAPLLSVAGAGARARATPGLELLATAVLLLDAQRRVTYANPAAENLFELSRAEARRQHARASCSATRRRLRAAIDKAVMQRRVLHRAGARARRAGQAQAAPHLHGVARSRRTTRALLLEFRHIDQQLKIAREERLLEQQQANRELIRSLAHEIKNPLGGIRGAAQLLERELDRAAAARVHAGDHRRGRPPAVAREPAAHAAPPAARTARTNIHEVLVRVRSVRAGRVSRRSRDAAATSTQPARARGRPGAAHRRRSSTSCATRRRRSHGTRRAEIRLDDAHRARASRSRASAIRLALAVGDRGQRPGRAAEHRATRSSIRWCPAAKAAAASGSRSRRPSSPSTTARSNATACRAARSSPSCCRSRRCARAAA